MNTPASVPVGVQLYSLREQAAVDFPAVLDRLGAMGFVGVEFAGFYGLSPEDGRRCVGAHRPRSRERARRARRGRRVRSRARRAPGARLRHGRDPRCFAPGVRRSRRGPRAPPTSSTRPTRSPARAGSRSATTTTSGSCRRSTTAARRCCTSSITSTPTVFAEVDIYWAQVGGADPAALVAELGERRRAAAREGRAGATTRAAPMVAVGDGAIDIAGVLAAQPGGAVAHRRARPLRHRHVRRGRAQLPLPRRATNSRGADVT